MRGKVFHRDGSVSLKQVRLTRIKDKVFMGTILVKENGDVEMM